MATSTPGPGSSTPARRPTAQIEMAQRAEARGRGVRRLGPVLAWALAFADIGTSIYYVPGILYGQVGGLAPAYVLIATVAFVLVAMEHMEVAYRYPTGGGGVSAAVEAFGARVGVVSGALMVSAYLIAIALSVVTAMHYLAALHLQGPWRHETVLFSVVAIVALGLASWVGIRAVARVTLVAAFAALLAHAALLMAVVAKLRPADWAELFKNVTQLGQVPWTEIATGVAGAWLAYSGLESLGQIAPAVREPRRPVVRAATILLVASVLITVPVFTALAVEAASAGHIVAQGALLAAVARDYGGRELMIAVAVSGAVLLLLAAKVAFIGCYSVFQAIGEHGYLPAAIAASHSHEETPRGATLIVGGAATALVIGTGGQPQVLASLFAFGLLGSYAITSVSLDVLRWREGRRGLAFYIGVLASLVLLVPWVTSWFTKWHAALYGAGVTGALMLVALITHRGWIRSGRFGFLSAAAAEESAAGLHTAVDVLTLNEAVVLKQTYPASTMVALRSPNPTLCREVARRVKGVGDSAIYVVFVDEIPGFLFPPRRGPSKEALRVLPLVVAQLREQGVDAVPIWRLAHDAGASIAEAAEELGVSCVFIGTNHRSAVWHFLQGHVLKRLIGELPENVRVVICE